MMHETLTTALRQLLQNLDSKSVRISLPLPTSQVLSDTSHSNHMHLGWQLNTALNGEYNVRFPTGRETVGPGRFLIVPPGYLHSALDFDEADSRETVELVTMETRPDAFLVRFKGTSVDVGKTFEAEAYIELCNQLSLTPERIAEQIADSVNENDLALSRTRLTAWLSVLITGLLPILHERRHQKEGRSERVIHEVIEILHQEYHRSDLNLENISAKVGLSANYLSRLFKKQTGQNLRRTLIRIRLEKAHHLLRTKRYSIKQVASLTGWSNQLYFSTAFRKRFGIPPSRVNGGGAGSNKRGPKRAAVPSAANP